MATRRQYLRTAHKMSQNRPRPKFKLGDWVKSRSTGHEGEVSFIGEYDDFLGLYRYKVLEPSGRRNYWNEADMKNWDKDDIARASWKEEEEEETSHDPARQRKSSSVMVWDNGGVYGPGGLGKDRYTVAIAGYSGYDIFIMSSRPLHPHGVNMYSTTLSGFNPSGWGTRVTLKSLPAEVKRAIDLRKSEMRGGHSGSSYAMYPAAKRRHPAGTSTKRDPKSHKGTHYFSVIIPFAGYGVTKWHPTERTGSFSVLTRGNFPSRKMADAWASANLGGYPYSIKRYSLT